ncbi:MAG: 50S ribosomal protein L18e [Candidatus Marsarchaeota archaeon]|jgi:large subunit ribosomal protein L18e|nr:50S ribosomal protein L18e [Candidatus Marsarchaeota archaeon]
MKITPERNDIKAAISMLSEMSKGEGAKPIAKRLHSLIAVPKRRRVSVNLYKIDKYTKEGDNVIVPGKVLSSGVLSHKVNIAAIEFSEGALESINQAGSSTSSIKDMLSKKNVRIIV